MTTLNDFLNELHKTDGHYHQIDSKRDEGVKECDCEGEEEKELTELVSE